MKFLSLRKNALFLSCWYERARPVQMVCFVILMMSILLLSFLSFSLNDTRIEKVMEALFYVIVGLQVVVVLVQGTMFAMHMGSRERLSETLDFHRNSPQPVGSKIFGLVFGSAWFEWIVFLVLFLVEIPFVFLPKVELNHILLFNFTLILTAVLFHTAAVTMSLLSAQKKRGGSLIALLLIVYIGGHSFLFFLSSSASPFLSYLFGWASFFYIYDPQKDLVAWFYIFELPVPVMQLLVQLPVWLLLLHGLKRIFQKPNSPAWSKADILRFGMYVFFMTTGFFLANFAHLDELISSNYRSGYYSTKHFFEKEVAFFTCIFVAVGMITAMFSVPSYFKRSKLMVLSRQGLVKKNVFDDGASGLFTMICFMVLGGCAFMPYLNVISCSLGKGLYSILMLSCYILAFAGFLEFFRLSRFRHKKIFFITVLLVWWLFIPWMSFLVFKNLPGDNIMGAALSPIFGVGYVISMLLDTHGGKESFFISPVLMAVVMWILAFGQHRLLERQVTKTS